MVPLPGTERDCYSIPVPVRGGWRHPLLWMEGGMERLPGATGALHALYPLPGTETADTPFP